MTLETDKKAKRLEKRKKEISLAIFSKQEYIKQLSEEVKKYICQKEEKNIWDRSVV